jgi:AAA+ superfamily predicted ATPase
MNGRHDVKHPNEHGELKRVVNSFLQMLDNYVGDSIIIAATNHQHLLDSAVWRRFDEVIFFDKPNEDEICNLLKKNLKRYPTKDLNFLTLAKKLTGNAHSDIERLCQNSIRKAILKNITAITHEELEQEINLLDKRNKIYKD